jgi:hypothetical protein
MLRTPLVAIFSILLFLLDLLGLKIVFSLGADRFVLEFVRVGLAD